VAAEDASVVPAARFDADAWLAEYVRARIAEIRSSPADAAVCHRACRKLYKFAGRTANAARKLADNDCIEVVVKSLSALAALTPPPEARLVAGHFKLLEKISCYSLEYAARIDAVGFDVIVAADRAVSHSMAASDLLSCLPFVTVERRSGAISWPECETIYVTRGDVRTTLFPYAKPEPAAVPAPAPCDDAPDTATPAPTDDAPAPQSADF
jgi:hypothetical protein